MTRTSGFLLLSAGIAISALYTYVSLPSAMAQDSKPVIVTHIFTGPDGLTHADEISMKLSGNPKNQASEMLKASGAEIHRYPAGNVNDWHVAPRRQLVITVAGKAEIEVAGGKRVPIPTGNLLLVEDVTGKGHITRVVGAQDRVTVQIPLTGPIGSLR